MKLCVFSLVVTNGITVLLCVITTHNDLVAVQCFVQGRCQLRIQRIGGRQVNE